MSFPQQERIYEVIEPLIRQCAKWRVTRSQHVSAADLRRGHALYGSDKPDLRLPPFHCVEDLFPGNLSRMACRWWRFAFRRPARLSRSERDALKAFGKERGLRVYDDPKRLDRDFPDAMAKSASAPVRPKTTCYCSPAGPASPRASVPKKPC